MNVLLTGPFGKIGCRVIEALLDQNHQVTCYDLDTPANRKVAKNYASRITIQWGDITDESSVVAAVNNAEAVIHNAALIPPATDRNLALSEKVNVGGTETIIRAIEAREKKPLLIFPSSISVHGLQNIEQDDLVTVSDTLSGDDNYAAQKIRCEKLIENSNVPWVIVRIGACMEGTTRLPWQDTKELLHMMFAIHPKARLEYVHTKDVAIAMVNAIDNKKALGKKFLLGGGPNCRTRWKEFNGLALAAIGITPFTDEEYGSESYYTHWMETSDSQQILNFQQHSLKDYQRELEDSYRWTRFFLRPFGALIKWLLKRYAGSQTA